MKQILKLLLVLLFITSFGCTSDSVCTTPAEPFIFEFVDVDTGANLFAIGAFDSKQAIIVTDLDTSKEIQYTYMKNEDLNRLVINSIGWQTGIFNYSISYGGKNIFELHVSAERVSENHCSFTKIKSIQIKNIQFQLDSKTGVYKVLFKQFLN
jgi:hypothetical protein